MVTVPLVLAVVLAPAAGPEGRSTASGGELGRLQGTWRLVRVEQDGGAGPAVGIELVIRGKAARVGLVGEAPEKANRYACRAAPDGRAGSLDFVPERETDQPLILLYRAEGDRLTFCAANLAGNGPRPAAFHSRNGQVLFVFERVRP
jgi:uncharacterized protein (TIGR03067 family)